MQRGTHIRFKSEKMDATSSRAVGKFRKSLQKAKSSTKDSISSDNNTVDNDINFPDEINSNNGTTDYDEDKEATDRDEEAIAKKLEIQELAIRQKTKDALEKWGVKKSDTGFDLTAKSFLDDEYALIANALKYTDTYTFASLTLARCFISSPELKTILSGLKLNTYLTSIDISSTKVNDDGCVALQYGLANNNLITTLDVRNCEEITDRGAAALLSLIFCTKFFDEDYSADELTEVLSEVDMNAFDFDQQEQKEKEWISGCELPADAEPDSEDENGEKIKPPLHKVLSNSEDGPQVLKGSITNWRKEVYDKADQKNLLPKIVPNKLTSTLSSKSLANLLDSGADSSNSNSKSKSIADTEDNGVDESKNLNRRGKSWSKLKSKSSWLVKKSNQSEQIDEGKSKTKPASKRAGKSWSTLKSKRSWLTSSSKGDKTSDKAAHPLAEADDGDDIADVLATTLANLVIGDDDEVKKQMPPERVKPKGSILKRFKGERNGDDEEANNSDEKSGGTAQRGITFADDEADAAADKLAENLLSDVIGATGDPTGQSKKNGGLFGSLKAASKFRTSLQKKKDLQRQQQQQQQQEQEQEQQEQEQQHQREAEQSAHRKLSMIRENDGAKAPSLGALAGGKGSLWKKSMKKIRTHDFVTHARSPLCPNLISLCGLPVNLLLEDQIKKLDLHDHGLTSVEAYILAFLLRSSQKIEEIDFSKNKFRSRSVKILGKALSNLGNLRVCDFSDNYLYASGGYEVGVVFSNCENLEELYVTNIELTNSGEEPLHIRKTKFDLSTIRPTMRSAKKMLRLLKKHTVLVVLDVEENEVDNYLLTQITNRLKVNKALRHTNKDFEAFVDEKFLGAERNRKRKKIDRKTTIHCDTEFFERENIAMTEAQLVFDKGGFKEDFVETKEGGVVSGLLNLGKNLLANVGKKVEETVALSPSPPSQKPEVTAPPVQVPVPALAQETLTAAQAPSLTPTLPAGEETVPPAEGERRSSQVTAIGQVMHAKSRLTQLNKKKKKRGKKENEKNITEWDDSSHRYFLNKLVIKNEIIPHTIQSRHEDRKRIVVDAVRCNNCVGCITMTRCQSLGAYGRIGEFQDLLKMGMLKGTLQENLKFLRTKSKSSN